MLLWAPAESLAPASVTGLAITPADEIELLVGLPNEGGFVLARLPFPN